MLLLLARVLFPFEQRFHLLDRLKSYSFEVYSAMKDTASTSLPSHPVVDPLVTVSFAASLFHEVQKFGEVMSNCSSDTNSEFTAQISEETQNFQNRPVRLLVKSLIVKSQRTALKTLIPPIFLIRLVTQILI